MILAILATASSAGRCETTSPPHPSVAVGPSQRLSGVYSSDAHPRDASTITGLGDGAYRVTSNRFNGVGLYDGVCLAGVVRTETEKVARTPTGAPAWFRIELRNDDSLDVTRWVGPSPTSVAHEVWGRTGDLSDLTPGNPAPPPGEQLPDLHENVYVTALPDPIQKVQPEYPADAQHQRIEGTVLLQVLVGRDGVVKDAKVVKSIPALDAAAIAAVRQWRFKPALREKEPVAVWVAVPIGFHLKQE
jgi:protein TonB